VGERVDVWTLHVMSIALEALPADVPDNRPLSGGSVGECDLTMMLPSRAMLYIRTLASRIKAA
jgi:hypothetical protein